MRNKGVNVLVVLSLHYLFFAWAQPPALRAIGVDSSWAAIPIEAILSGGPPPQGIPALGFSGDYAGAAQASPEPKFVTQESIDWLADEEPVILIRLSGESKIYPLQILTWHEIVNDSLGGVPIAVTFCPLCNSALAFDRRIPFDESMMAEMPEQTANLQFAQASEDYLAAYADQERSSKGISNTLEVTFGVSGMLYNSNMLMFDTASSTLWSQLLGEATVGRLTGTRLLRYPAPILSFAEAKAAFPEAPVLSRDTGFSRSYGRNPYVGYDEADSPAFLFRGISDGRLLPKERVISFALGEEVVAYPFSELQSLNVVNDVVDGEAVAVFWQSGTNSALDASSIAASNDIGAANVFRRQLGERILSFRWDGSKFIDAETGSSWNLLGQAISGELAGSQLDPIVHDNTLWFAWAAFKPETLIYQAPQ